MSKANDAMSPDASPGKLNRSSGVRRVNNWPMYIIGAATAIFLLIMMLVAADRSGEQSEPKDKKSEKRATVACLPVRSAVWTRTGSSQARQNRQKCQCSTTRPRANLSGFRWCARTTLMRRHCLRVRRSQM